MVRGWYSWSCCIGGPRHWKWRSPKMLALFPVACERAHEGGSRMRSEVTWPSVPAMVRDGARRHAGTDAVVDGDRRVTYAELSGLVDRAARGLMAAGIERGDRV